MVPMISWFYEINHNIDIMIVVPMISECHDSFAYPQQRHPPHPPTPCSVPPVPSLAPPSLASPSSLSLPSTCCQSAGAQSLSCVA